MTTDTVQLPWDYFLQKYARTENAVAMVNGYRLAEWKNTKRGLLQQYRWAIPEGLEPHWVEPGKAVYWQEQHVRVVRFVSNETEEEIPHTADNIDKGHNIQVWDGNGEWKPTGPLPAHAGGIAGYLKKGFRLRPPQEGVAAEILRESADLLEAASEEPKKGQFICYRHDKGKVGFDNWGAYVKHCQHYQETLLEAPPQDVLQRAATFGWYCPLHDVGWNKQKPVLQHYKSERKKPGGHYHPTVEDMLVKKET